MICGIVDGQTLLITDRLVPIAKTTLLYNVTLSSYVDTSSESRLFSLSSSKSDDSHIAIYPKDCLEPSSLISLNNAVNILPKIPIWKLKTTLRIQVLSSSYFQGSTYVLANGDQASVSTVLLNNSISGTVFA
jgi:hypothetical protein